MNTKDWMREQIIEAAELFYKEAVSEDPPSWEAITEWESEFIKTGYDTGCISFNGPKFRINHSKKQYSLYSFNREYIVQLAAYTALITDLGYSANDCCFESKCQYWDAAVLDSPKRIHIAVEAKSSDKKLNELVNKLLNEFNEPVNKDEPTRNNEPLSIAKRIIKTVPSFVWFVSPNVRKAFRCKVNGRMFTLEASGEYPPHAHAT